ncbi:hypothetical protein T484DRAFT_3254951, partial [Baffinella frigidus]
DAGSGGSCVLCESGTYKNVRGSAACSVCPSNAVSAVGSTWLSSCVCPEGFSGDAGAGERCVACEAGRFKPFEGPGACLSCPGDGVSAEEGRSCACGAGHFLVDNLPRLSCGGSSSSCTSCTPSVGMSEGTLVLVPQEDSGIGNVQYHNCEWRISGAEPRVTVSWEYSGSENFLVAECNNAESYCDSYGTNRLGSSSTLMSGERKEYESATGHLRVYASGRRASCLGFTATWSTGTSKPPVCSPCEAGDYKDSTDAACTACPSNAVSAEGSTSLSACTCPAGFTGDPGSGGSCVQCGPDTYKNVGGSAACTLCPSNAVSAEGSMGCVCPEGFSGDAGAGESCVACVAGTFKPFNGSETCLSCPSDGVSAEEGSSCACGAGHFFEDNVPMLSCSSAYYSPSESCSCTPSVGLNSGTLVLQAYARASSYQSCYWIISGVEPRVTVTYLHLAGLGSGSNMMVSECSNARECGSGYSSERVLGYYYSGDDAKPVQQLQSSTGFLGVRLYSNYLGGQSSMTAMWSTTSKAPVCSPCKAGTYKDTDAAACTACPSNAVSAEGSTSLSACTCPAGFTGDAGGGGSCIRCGSGTYKGVGGSAACSVCPSNAVSAEGSTGLSSCVCPEGFSGDAGAGGDCVACEAGTFKPFNGTRACLSCPVDGVSAEEGRSCACGAGHFFEDNVPRLSCGRYSSESCPCTPSVGLDSGTISVQAGSGGSSYRSCSWIISGAEPRVTITHLHLVGLGSSSSMWVAETECSNAAECGSGYGTYRYLGVYDSIREATPGQQLQSSTGHILLGMSSSGEGLRSSMNVTWSTTSKAPGCSPCEADTYKDTTDAACTACPSNAVSAEGSTSLSACTCPAGFSGDAGSGGSCVLCESDTYKDVGGSAACTLCPSNAVSAVGSTGLSSCACPEGFSGDAGAGESCVACEAGTFKSFEGPGACLSCPGDGVSAEEGRSCACGAGHFFVDNVPMLSCSGGSSGLCSCTPSVGMSEGVINLFPDVSSISSYQTCSWIISGAEPRLTIYVQAIGSGGNSMSLNVDQCDDAECASGYHSLARYQSQYQSNLASFEVEIGTQFQSTTGHLRLSFSFPRSIFLLGLDSMSATWSTGASKAPGCSPCKADTYKDTTDGSACTACPCRAVAEEGSTSLSACTCPAGFTGDAGSGGSCVPCAAGTYKDVRGSAACSWCGVRGCTSKVLEDWGASHPRWGEDPSVASCSLDATCHPHPSPLISNP